MHSLFFLFFLFQYFCGTRIGTQDFELAEQALQPSALFALVYFYGSCPELTSDLILLSPPPTQLGL
jgi:hypothetical protein